MEERELIERLVEGTIEKRTIELKQKTYEELKEENERLNTNLDELQNAIDNIAEIVGVPEGMCVEDVYDKIKDYKSRIDKALDKITTEQLYTNYSWGKTYYSQLIKDLRNILQGEDNE